MTYLKPCFDIQRVHVEGAKLYYELFYIQNSKPVKVVDACFMSINDAAEYRDNLLEEY